MCSHPISYSEWKRRNEELRFRYNIETNNFHHRHGIVSLIVSRDATEAVTTNVGFAI